MDWRPTASPQISMPSASASPLRRIIMKRRGSATDDESAQPPRGPRSPPLYRQAIGYLKPALKRGRTEERPAVIPTIETQRPLENNDDDEESSDDEEFRRVRDTLKPLNPHRWSVSRDTWIATSLMHKVRRRRASSVEEDKARRIIRYPSTFKIITWNLSQNEKSLLFVEPEIRHRAIMANIQTKVFKCTDEESPVPCIILLQEVKRNTINVILDQPWVRKFFIALPASPRDSWPESAPYGNLTLVSRKIPVVAAYTLEFPVTRMNCNAVFVDVRLKLPSSSASSPIDGSEGRFSGENPPSPQDGTPSPTSPRFRIPKTVMIRIANTQLEKTDAGLRRRQLRLVAGALHANVLAGGIIGGDMSAFNPEYEHHQLPDELGLTDAWPFDYEIPTSAEFDEIDAAYTSGATWGFQPKGQTPPGRIDKLLYMTRDVDYRLLVSVPDRLGKGLKSNNGRSEGWASEHWGLLSDVSLAPPES